MIAFDGEVIKLMPLGGRRVRLDNGHLITVLPSLGAPDGRLAAGRPRDGGAGGRLSTREGVVRGCGGGARESDERCGAGDEDARGTCGHAPIVARPR